MPFGVALFLDLESERAVRALWQRLADEGVSRTMLDAGIGPHVTLVVSPALDASRAEPLLEAVAREAPAIETRLSSIGAFPGGDRFAFLAPVVSAPLLALQDAARRAVERAGGEPEGYYAAGAWVPHVSVAGELTPEELGRAVAICAAATLPASTRLERLSLVEFPPVRELRQWPLVDGAR